ncbi:MAG: UDP-2,3-diacylglucosamine diphosphatase LpxI [Pseudomonadota bacterium]
MPDRLAIIAGRGSLPRELAAGTRYKGQEPILIGVEGEYEPWISDYEHHVAGLGKFGQILKILNDGNAKQVVMAGSVTRPKIELSKMDWGAIRSLPEVFAFMLGGDNSLLSGVINLFEKRGISVIGAHEVLPELLAEKGVISGRNPAKKSMNNISKAFEACKALGKLDIGQGAVAIGGRVIAVEGIEGTDGMLKRVAEMRSTGRLYENGTFGVLVKTMKPGQDMRVDLPAIGSDTIENAANAGLRGIAVEAGQSLILERKDTLQLAKQHNVFIYGLSPEFGK